METKTQLVMFGSLREKMNNFNESPILFDLSTPTKLVDVLKRFNISLDIVQLAMVNHKAVPRDSIIHPGDRVALFPKGYPVFIDWKNFRFL